MVAFIAFRASKPLGTGFLRTSTSLSIHSTMKISGTVAFPEMTLSRPRRCGTRISSRKCSCVGNLSTPANKPLQQTNATLVRSKVGCAATPWAAPAAPRGRKDEAGGERR